MLKFEEFTLSTEGRVLFRLPKLELHSGAFALMGRNGSGKSTFLRAILGDHQEYTGRIEINGRAVHAFQKQDLAKEVAVVYSKPELFGYHTVREVLMLGRLPYQRIWSKESESDRLIVFRVAALLEIEFLLERTFVKLSDGEKQLVMIGRALVQDTPVLLMDEPSAFLDIVHRRKLITAMKAVLNDSGKLILFSTHHTDFLSEFCHKVLLIERGEMTVFGDPLHFERDIQRSFFPDL